MDTEDGEVRSLRGWVGVEEGRLENQGVGCEFGMARM